jgi:hypothetical protein
MPEDRGSAWSGIDLPGLPQRVLKILLPLRETVKIGHPSAQLRVFLEGYARLFKASHRSSGISIRPLNELYSRTSNFPSQASQTITR